MPQRAHAPRGRKPEQRLADEGVLSYWVLLPWAGLGQRQVWVRANPGSETGLC